MVEDNLWWKTTFGGGRPVVEDGPFVEDDLWWKMTFCGRQPLVNFCMLPPPIYGIFFFSTILFFQKKINPFGPKLDHLDIYQYGITMGNNVGYA